MIFEKQFWLTNKKDTPSNKSAKPSTSQNEPSITGQHKNKKPEPCSQKTWFTQKKNRPQKLCQYVEEHPDACLKELAKQFNVKNSSMQVALVKLKITRKKIIYLQRKIRKRPTNLPGDSIFNSRA